MSGPLLALGAASVWGISDFCGGLATRRASSALIVMISHGLGLLVLTLFLWMLHPPAPSHGTIFYGFLAGIACGSGLLLLYEGLSHGSMGLVAALSGVLTAMVPVLASFLTEGRPTGLQLAGFLAAMVAIWLIVYTPGSSVHLNGLLAGAASGICFGFLLYFLHLAGKSDLLWAIAFSRLGSVSCAIVFGLFLVWRGTRPLLAPVIDWSALLLLAAVAGLLDTAGNLLYTASSLRGRLDVAAVLASLYPAGTILLAIFFLKERATRNQTAGMVLALLAVVMISA
jgi:drug/metabolite transporter (DMT)-like permease